MSAYACRYIPTLQPYDYVFILVLKRIVQCLIAIIILRLLLLDIIIIDDSILHYSITPVCTYMSARRLFSLERYIYICECVYRYIYCDVYCNTIVVDVEQYMLISCHNVVVSYKNRFYHNFTNTRGAPLHL